jgi:MoaA/NifB/PqqE/SkfB family radical SAM enzyme
VGAKRSVVQNLYTGEAMWCDEQATQALVESESNVPCETPPELFQTLAQRGWGFFAERPPFVDKLRTYNVFREKRLWKETPYLGLAVLQVTNRCVRRCQSCSLAFCPICKVFPEATDSLPTADWTAILEELAGFGARQVLFTGGEPLLREDLPELALIAARHGMGVQVHTTGLVPLPAGFPDVAFSVLVVAQEDLPRIAEILAGRQHVVLLMQDLDPALTADQVPSQWQALRISASPPRLGKADLLVTGFDRFFARKLTDSCLNGKIYIGHDGRVFPCFGHRGSAVADIRADGVPAAIQTLVDQYWNVPVDRAEAARKCNRCEFRFCCGSCRYLDVEARCAYDVKSGAWR